MLLYMDPESILRTQYMFANGLKRNQTSMETDSYFICPLSYHFSHLPSASFFLSICSL